MGWLGVPPGLGWRQPISAGIAHASAGWVRAGLSGRLSHGTLPLHMVSILQWANLALLTRRPQEGTKSVSRSAPDLSREVTRPFQTQGLEEETPPLHAKSTLSGRECGRGRSAN